MNATEMLGPTVAMPPFLRPSPAVDDGAAISFAALLPRSDEPGAADFASLPTAPLLTLPAIEPADGAPREDATRLTLVLEQSAAMLTGRASNPMPASASAPVALRMVPFASVVPQVIAPLSVAPQVISPAPLAPRVVAPAPVTLPVAASAALPVPVALPATQPIETSAPTPDLASVPFRPTAYITDAGERPVPSEKFAPHADGEDDQLPSVDIASAVVEPAVVPSPAATPAPTFAPAIAILAQSPASSVEPLIPHAPASVKTAPSPAPALKQPIAAALPTMTNIAPRTRPTAVPDRGIGTTTQASQKITAAPVSIANETAPPIAAITLAPINTPTVQSAAFVPTPMIVAERHLDLARGDAWLDDLARDIAATASSGGRLKFALVPETLGRLDVDIRREDAGVHVHLAARTEAARDALAVAQPRIAEEIRANGVRLAGTEVSAGLDGERGHQAARHAPVNEPVLASTATPAPLPSAPRSTPDTTDGRYA